MPFCLFILSAIQTTSNDQQIIEALRVWQPEQKMIILIKETSVADSSVMRVESFGKPQTEAIIQETVMRLWGEKKNNSDCRELVM